MNANPAIADTRAERGVPVWRRYHSRVTEFFADQARSATAASEQRRCQTEGRYGVRTRSMKIVAEARKPIAAMYPRRDVNATPRVRGQIQSTRKIGTAMLTTAW